MAQTSTGLGSLPASSPSAPSSPSTTPPSQVRYRKASELTPGGQVVDPSTGLWCDLYDVQSDGTGCWWLVWGAVRPPKSLATKVRESTLVSWRREAPTAVYAPEESETCLGLD